MPDLLASIVVDILGDDSALRQTMNQSVNFAKSAGDRVGSAFSLGFNNPILNAVASVDQLVGGVQQLVRLTTQLSGMQVAAEFGQFRRQLVGIAGDANKASRAFKGLQDIANNSNFDADQIMKFGVRQAGRTGDVGGAVNQTQKLVDAAAAFGVQNKDFDMFQFNTAQIQNQGGGKARVEDIRQFQNYAPLATTRIAEALGISVAEASKKLMGATGNQFVDMLNKVGDKNKGAAAAASGSDPFAVGANIVDSFKSAIEPTGAALNSVFTPILTTFKSGVDIFGQFNAVTGGQAGIIAIIGGGILVFRSVGGAAIGAYKGVRDVTTSLIEMAGAAEIAAKANRDKAGTDLVAAGTGAVGAVAGGVGGVAGATGLARAFLSIGKVVEFAKSATGIGLVATAVDLGANYIGGRLNHGGASSQQRGLGAGISGLGTGVGLGALVGGIVGSVFPVIGTAIGAAAGAAIGGIGGGAAGMISEKMRQNKEGGSSAAMADHAKAMAAHTDALKTSSRVLGGGARAGASASSFEREWAVYSLMHGNAVGVG